MHRLLFAIALFVFIFSGCSPETKPPFPSNTEYNVQFKNLSLKNGWFNKNWFASSGAWTTTERGWETTIEKEAILLFKPEVDWTTGVKIEYTASSETPGDLSLLLGAADRFKPVKNSIFIGFGAGANTKTEIEVPDFPAQRTTETLIIPGKIHTVNVTISDCMCVLSIDGKQVLASPCQPKDIKGNRIALYGWMPARFHSFRVKTAGGLQYPPSYPYRKEARMKNQLTILPRDNMEQALKRLQAQDPLLMAAYTALIERADKALQSGPFSVMDKELTPPSGDKHDYMSIGTYWWPNPDTPDGLPYIRKDGVTNPEGQDGSTDKKAYNQMVNGVFHLTLAYYFSGEEKYADHAALLVKTWFLHPETKMNPHLEYAQAIPGRNEGRGIGIIDTRQLLYLQDMITLLLPSRAWTDANQQELIQWYSDYLTWLRTSNNGRDEARQHNNHGTWYDAQCAAFALFTGYKEQAFEIMQISRDRILDHIAPDGSQPHELSRTRTFNYSCMNLESLMILADISRTVGLDFWNLNEDGHGSIAKALDFLLEKAPVEDITKWPYKQITPIEKSIGSYNALILRAAYALDNENYFKQAEKMQDEAALENVWRLLYPPKEVE